MSSPFASSSFFALITGGMNAPSEGKSKMTIFSLVRFCAAAGIGEANVKASAASPQPARKMLENPLIIPPPLRRALFLYPSLGRSRGQFTPERREELLDQVLGDAFQDTLANA